MRYWVANSILSMFDNQRIFSHHNWIGLIDVVIRVRINGKDGTLFYGALGAWLCLTKYKSQGT